MPQYVYCVSRVRGRMSCVGGSSDKCQVVGRTKIYKIQLMETHQITADYHGGSEGRTLHVLLDRAGVAARVQEVVRSPKASRRSPNDDEQEDGGKARRSH